MTREEAKKELIAMLEEAEGGPSYSMEEVDAYMRELLHPKNQIYLTGDTHGQFERIISFCERQQVQPESTFIILGDVGLNYYGDRRDNRGKDNLTKIPITFFCIHGNHEMRPSEELGYQVKEYHGGKVWVQPEYPNLVFAIDGEIYDFFGHSCIVIGGAYSVDKYYRLARGYNWFEDEQPSDEIKEKVERMLSERHWKIDVVLSHTCPLRYEPTEVFLSMIDQSSVDKSTEQWLDTIESRLHYERWYCGHYHTDKEIDKIRFMFQDYTMLPHQISLSAEKEMIRRMQRQAEIVEALGLTDGSGGEIRGFYMSTYYDFMVETKYKDKWYNIDLHTKDFDGKLRHQYLATFSRSFVGQLESLIDGAWRIGFDDLAESTQNLLLSSIPAECEDSVRLEQFYVAGNLADFEKLLKAPYQNEYYVTRNQIAAYESHEIDDICDYLTVHEVLELPYTARSEYVLYRWNDVFDNAEKIRSMVDRLRFQVECFNEALPYEAGQSYGDRAASQVRVIYRIS